MKKIIWMQGNDNKSRKSGDYKLVECIRMYYEVRYWWLMVEGILSNAAKVKSKSSLITSQGDLYVYLYVCSAFGQHWEQMANISCENIANGGTFHGLQRKWHKQICGNIRLSQLEIPTYLSKLNMYLYVFISMHLNAFN